MGEKPAWDYIFLAAELRRTANVMGILGEPFPAMNGCKTFYKFCKFLLSRTLTATQIAELPGKVDEKNRLESEQTLISNLYLCLGEEDRMNCTKANLIRTWGLHVTRGCSTQLRGSSKRNAMNRLKFSACYKKTTDRGNIGVVPRCAQWTSGALLPRRTGSKSYYSSCETAFSAINRKFLNYSGFSSFFPLFFRPFLKYS